MRPGRLENDTNLFLVVFIGVTTPRLSSITRKPRTFLGVLAHRSLGAPGETRTPDPLLKRQVLCQLSYGRKNLCSKISNPLLIRPKGKTHCGGPVSMGTAGSLWSGKAGLPNSSYGRVHNNFKKQKYPLANIPNKPTAHPKRWGRLRRQLRAQK